MQTSTSSVPSTSIEPEWWMVEEYLHWEASLDADVRAGIPTGVLEEYIIPYLILEASIRAGITERTSPSPSFGLPDSGNEPPLRSPSTCYAPCARSWSGNPRTFDSNATSHTPVSSPTPPWEMGTDWEGRPDPL